MKRKIAEKSGKTYHHGDLRNALLEAAVELIRTHGPSAISLREVAKLAGVSHTAPYRHFEDKHALLAAIAEEGFRRLGQAMTDVSARYKEPRTQLVEAGKAYVDLAVANPEVTQLMFGGYLDPERCSDGVRIQGDLAFQGLLSIIENGKNAGILKSLDSMTLATATWSLAHGFAMLIAGGQMSHIAKSKKEIDKLSRTLGTLLLEGIANE